MIANCEIKETQGKGEGMFATQDIKRGDIVLTCEIEMDDCQNSVHASQVDMGKWVTFKGMGRMINHSCNPTCGIGFDGSNWLYIAFRDIKEGEELTYDYAMANYIIENMPQCFCGFTNCRRDIKKFCSLPAQKKKEYIGFYAPYLQKLAKQQQNP